jgi:transcriptional regulator with XRE-family HTH domain
MGHARHPDAYDREIALRVRTLRLSRRMSQNDVGERLGITFQQIQKYENGANRIGAGRLQRIAEIFEVPVAALFGASRREGRAGVDPFAGLAHPRRGATARSLRPHRRPRNPPLVPALRQTSGDNLAAIEPPLETRL